MYIQECFLRKKNNNASSCVLDIGRIDVPAPFRVQTGSPYIHAYSFSIPTQKNPQIVPLYSDAQDATVHHTQDNTHLLSSIHIPVHFHRSMSLPHEKTDANADCLRIPLVKYHIRYYWRSKDTLPNNEDTVS